MESKDPNQIRTVLDRSPRSNVRMYELLDLLNEDWVHCYLNNSAVLFVSWSIMLWAEKQEDLIPLLKFIPTSQLESGLFCIEDRFIPLLEKHVAPVSIDAECHAWTLDKLLEEAPALDSLTLEDAPFVNDHWDYKSEDSIEFIQRCIQTMPTSCIRNQSGQPIAMAFCYGQSPHHINMGGFKVLPEHRRHGLGKQVHLDMCSKVLKQDRKPLVHVKTDNTVSQHICQTTNFTRHERVIWGNLNFQKQHSTPTNIS